MPLTFAHPAAILLFPRKSKWVNFTALVFGSMAPDFEYFLRGQPYGLYGHTISGFFYFNLPFVILFAYIYHKLIHKTLMHHVPVVLQDSYIDRSTNNKMVNSIVFVYSAIIGMFTHVIWDSVTHANGFMVVKFSFLSKQITLFQFRVPVYKFLQHGGTLFGLGIIILYLFFRSKYFGQRDITKTTKQKIHFWISLIAVGGCIILTWYAIDYVPLFNYGIAVMRFFDSMIISLLIICVYHSLDDKKVKKQS
ncbi:DUF4184 family protein [Bacillus solimangrovi]|uniref:DUF4184 family protein n=1 Tax=Bacillus solimangrovi TaxID=1305675 RepID=A0A1E5LHK3_9BACI|nr:DUF4184 family protein [Bacillus solimangrovi]OEH93563.1 hypothetical protein BFG57_00820 [Bacillus solimangrovi]